MKLKLPKPVETCIDLLERSGARAYLVGGSVRDHLLGRDPGDWDVCTTALPEEVTKCFSDYKVIPTGLKHGTVTVRIEGMPIEVTTFRTDGAYRDHRRPESVAFTDNLHLDLARRDFTINAVAFHPQEGLVDPYGGAKDLSEGVIRCVGEADERFREDALRILRMFRFACKLDFSVAPDSLTAAQNCCELLGFVSGERILSELQKLLSGAQPGRVLQMMTRSGVLQQIIPEFASVVGFQQHTPYHDRTIDLHTFAAVDAAPAEWPVRMALLLHDIGKPQCFRLDGEGVGHFKGHPEAGAKMAVEILRRLHCDRKSIDLVGKLIALHEMRIPPEQPALRKLAATHGTVFLRQLLAVRIADTRAKPRAFVQKRLSDLMDAHTLLGEMCEQGTLLGKGDLAVGGNDLIALGYSPGPALGEELARLTDLVLEDPARNDRALLLALARQQLDKEGT